MESFFLNMCINTWHAITKILWWWGYGHSHLLRLWVKVSFKAWLWWQPFGLLTKESHKDVIHSCKVRDRSQVGRCLHLGNPDSFLHWLPPPSPRLPFSSSVTHILHAAIFVDLFTMDDKWLLRNRVPIGERSPEPTPTLFAVWNSRLFNLLYLILRTPDSTFLNDFPLLECLHSYLWRRRKRIDESFAGNRGGRSVVGTADGWVCGHVAVSVGPSTTLWTRLLWESGYTHFGEGAAPAFRY